MPDLLRDHSPLGNYFIQSMNAKTYLSIILILSKKNAEYLNIFLNRNIQYNKIINTIKQFVISR